MNIPKTGKPRIVVIGCGFAGLKFIKNIDSSKYQIVLFDKNNYHTFQPLLYQVATAGLEPDSIVYPIRKIFKRKKDFHFRMTSVVGINTDNKEVETEIGNFSYDYLVVATGGTTNFFGMESMEKLAMPMKSLLQALDLRSLILQNFEHALTLENPKDIEKWMNIVIVGGGPTGIELAGALSELRDKVLPRDYPELDLSKMQIHIVDANKRVLSAMTEKASKKTTKYIQNKNIRLWSDTRVTGYDGNNVITHNGYQIESKTVIWAAGVQGLLPKKCDFELTRGNRILVNEYHEVKNQENVYAIGDIAFTENAKEPIENAMMASVAEQQGKHLAINFSRLAKNKHKTAFRYKNKGVMAVFGRNKAVVNFGKTTYGGFFGWATWMFVHLMLLVDFRDRLLVFVSWAYNYIAYDEGIRLIIRKYKRKE